MYLAIKNIGPYNNQSVVYTTEDICSLVRRGYVIYEPIFRNGKAIIPLKSELNEMIKKKQLKPLKFINGKPVV